MHRYEYETDNVIIDSEYGTDEVSTPLGCSRTTGFSVERVRVYIPFVDDFVDMTHESSVVKRATRTIMEHLREF